MSNTARITQVYSHLNGFEKVDFNSKNFIFVFEKQQAPASKDNIIFSSYSKTC